MKRWIPVASILCCLLAYSPVWDAGFLWDDDDYVTHNPVLRDHAGLREIWTRPRSLPQWYPVAHTALWCEFQLFGTEPRGYHVVNVLLHALAGLLFARLLRRAAIPGAELAAALFLLHPVHVESVAWITEIKNTLSLVLSLASALAWYRGLAPGPTSRALWWKVGSFVLFALALGSKSITCALPAVLLILEWWHRGTLSKSSVLASLPFFGLGGVMAFLTVHFEKTHVLATGVDWNLSALDRLSIAGRAVWFYVGKLLVPLDLSFNYPRWQIDGSRLGDLAWPMLAVFVIAGLVVTRRRIGRGPIAGAMIFVGTLVPALGFFDVYPMRYSFVADHFVYGSSLSLLSLAAAMAHRAERVGIRWIRVVGAALLSSFAVLTFLRAQTFTSLDALWRDTLSKNPNSFLAATNLGGLLLERGDHESAIPLLELALRISPGDADAANDLGVAHFQKGDLASALAWFDRATASRPNAPQPHSNRGAVLLEEGRPAEALLALQRAVAIEPRFVEARRQLAFAHAEMGQPDDALAQAGIVLANVAPADPFRLDLAARLFARDAAGAALGLLAPLVRDPAAVDARMLAARCLHQERRSEDALAILGTVAVTHPQRSDVRELVITFSLGSSLSDPARALMRNVAVDGPLADVLERLADALATDGRLAAARLCAERAIRGLTELRRFDEAEGLRQRAARW